MSVNYERHCSSVAGDSLVSSLALSACSNNATLQQETSTNIGTSSSISNNNSSSSSVVGRESGQGRVGEEGNKLEMIVKEEDAALVAGDTEFKLYMPQRGEFSLK